MAFKLAGDQYTGIGLIQTRRVAELLSSNIPEEEALLTNSGRYVCLVCRRRPIFDTVAMLSLHRAGQKHIRAVHQLLRQKQLDRDELEKREQLKQFQKGREHVESTADDTSPLLVKAQIATKHALLRTAPYSPLAKKGSVKEGLSSGLFFSRKRGYSGDGGRVVEGPVSKKLRIPNEVTAAGGSSSSSVKPSEPEASESVKVKPTVKKKQPRMTEKGKVSIKTSRYVHLRSSGWVRDREGSWSKDPNVEFDSDEEEPL